MGTSVTIHISADGVELTPGAPPLASAGEAPQPLPLELLGRPGPVGTPQGDSTPPGDGPSPLPIDVLAGPPVPAPAMPDAHGAPGAPSPAPLPLPELRADEPRTDAEN